MAEVTPARRITVYDTDEGSFADSTTDQSSGFTNVTTAWYISISNDSVADDISIKLNANTNDSITIKGGESLILSGALMTALFLSNSSGNAVNYRVLMMGEA